MASHVVFEPGRVSETGFVDEAAHRAGFRADLQEATGVAPAFAIESFTDPVADVKQSILRVRRSDFLLYRDKVRGFVFDIETQRLREVVVDEGPLAS